MSIRIVFIVLIVGLNFGLAALVIHLLRRRRPRLAGLEMFVLAWATLMVGFALADVFGPDSWRPILRDWFYLPLSADMIWNLLFLQPLVLGTIIFALILGRARKVEVPAEPLAPQDLSRRRFLYMAACGAVPAASLAMGVHGTVTRYDLRVTELDIPIPNLPPELEGFTIAHVSDLHSGIFCGPERLRKIGDATNDLKADLIVITGDVINHDMSEFADAYDVIRRLEAPHGLYLCEGNHDLIPGPFAFHRRCAEVGLPLLWHSSAILPMGPSRLVLAGLPWYSSHSAPPRDALAGVYPDRQPGDVRVLLAHHPDLFDVAGDTDLVLSGHTHGGQIMVGDVGFGPMFFEYWSGVYRHGASMLVVSNGAGDWFPCRIGAPAEIGRLRLTRAS